VTVRQLNENSNSNLKITFKISLNILSREWFSPHSAYWLHCQSLIYENKRRAPDTHAINM